MFSRNLDSREICIDRNKKVDVITGIPFYSIIYYEMKYLTQQAYQQTYILRFSEKRYSTTQTLFNCYVQLHDFYK